MSLILSIDASQVKFHKLIPMKNYTQIAGVHDIADAKIIVSSGSDAIGFPLRLDIHNPYLSESSAKEIIHFLKDKATPVLITYLDKADEIIEFCSYLRVTWVQLHGDIPTKEIARIKTAAHHLSIIKSLVIREDNLVLLEEAVEHFSPHVDAFITDTYDPATGATGATGLTHDWTVSRRLVELSERPVILAGGLHAGNVSEAIREIQPAGVDVHTGVKNGGMRNDLTKVNEFISNAQKAFNEDLT